MKIITYFCHNLYTFEFMEYKLSFAVNDSIYLKNPESSEVGQHIVKHSIDLINDLGFEHFTFKKLAVAISSTEATVYRYFENKHRLLLYIITWYWFYLDYYLETRLQNLPHPKQQLLEVINVLTHEFPESSGGMDYNKKYLNHIVIAESSKVYLVKEVAEINRTEVFKPYKDLCARIADIITQYNQDYKYPKSLSTTIIETSHNQQFFSHYLPRLTDVKTTNEQDFVNHFLQDLVFRILG